MQSRKDAIQPEAFENDLKNAGITSQERLPSSGENKRELDKFERYLHDGNFDGMLSLGLRHMTMVSIGGIPYEQIASDIARNCPAEVRRKYPYQLLRLAYELYLGGKVSEYERLMHEIDETIPSLPLPQDEIQHLKGEWLIVSALPLTRDVAAVAEIYERAAVLLCGPSRVIDASDSITAGLHGFPGAYLLKPGTADEIKSYISRIVKLFSGFTGEAIKGFEELYEGSLAYYRGEYEAAKRLTYKALYLLENTKQSVLQISAGEMLAFIAMSQQDVDSFAEAIDYMKLAAERSTTPAACQGIVDLCRCGLLNTIGAISDTPAWMKALSFAEGTLTVGMFGQTVLTGNPHFAAPSSIPALWHHTIYLTASGQFERALAVSEIMLERLRDIPVLSICFLLASSFCYLSLGDREKAVHYLEQGLVLALPDRLYTLISDFTVYMDGIADQVLSKAPPEALNALNTTDSYIKRGQTALKQAYAEKKLPDSLTTREKEVAELAVQSMRNTDIAEALGISLNTVKMHLKSIYEKLSIDKRSKLREKLRQNS